MSNLANFANDGIDLVGKVLINNFLPAGSEIKAAANMGLDLATDLIFDKKKGTKVILSEHSEVAALVEGLVPVIVGLVDRSILKVVDIPFLDGPNEDMFEHGVLLQLEAVLRQAIVDFLSTKQGE